MRHQITIKEPCTESWIGMTPTEKGAFCDKCSKEVKDYTNTPAEVAALEIKEGAGSICGRFRKSQLDVPIQPRSTKIVIFFTALVLVFGGSLFTAEVQAQNAIVKGQTKFTYIDDQVPKSAKVNPELNEKEMMYLGEPAYIPEDSQEEVLEDETVDGLSEVVEVGKVVIEELNFVINGNVNCNSSGILVQSKPTVAITEQKDDFDNLIIMGDWTVDPTKDVVVLENIDHTKVIDVSETVKLEESLINEAGDSYLEQTDIYGFANMSIANVEQTPTVISIIEENVNERPIPPQEAETTIITPFNIPIKKEDKPVAIVCELVALLPRYKQEPLVADSEIGNKNLPMEPDVNVLVPTIVPLPFELVAVIGTDSPVTNCTSLLRAEFMICKLNESTENRGKDDELATIPKFDNDVEQASNAVQFSKEEVKYNISAFPNPVTNILKVMIEGSQSERIVLRLYDMNGKLVQVQSVRDANVDLVFNFNVMDLQNGTYILNVSQGANSSTKQIVVRH